MIRAYQIILFVASVREHGTAERWSKRIMYDSRKSPNLRSEQDINKNYINELPESLIFYRPYSNWTADDSIQMSVPSLVDSQFQNQSQSVQNTVHSYQNLVIQLGNGSFLPFSLNTNHNSNSTLVQLFVGSTNDPGSTTPIDPTISTSTTSSPEMSSSSISSPEVTTSATTDAIVSNHSVYRMCNTESSENLISFINPSYPFFDAGEILCVFRIKVNPSICQLRVDIVETNFASPENGVCNYQYLTVQGTIWPLGVNRICGHNINNHFYVEIIDDSVEPYIDIIITSNVISKFKWALWVSQIDCSRRPIIQAPPGCFQYHWEPSGYLQSFSYADNQYYSDQFYKICFLSPLNGCIISFEADGEFMLEKYGTVIEVPFNVSGITSLYCVRDYLRIPGGSATGEPDFPSHDRYCGGKFAPQHASAISLPILSPITSQIYIVEFVSGVPAEYAKACHGPGFNLKYEIITCNFRQSTENASNINFTEENVTLRPPDFLQKLYSS